MKVYLAGPMRGIPNFNFPAFHQAASMLRAAHYTVFSPAEYDEWQGLPNAETSEWYDGGRNIREALAADTAWICAHADAIALLPGWEKSKGACAEKALAEALGLEVIIL
jgi:hypothetical protein